MAATPDYLTYQGRLLAEPSSEPSSDHGPSSTLGAIRRGAVGCGGAVYHHVHFGRIDPRAAGFNSVHRVQSSTSERSRATVGQRSRRSIIRLDRARLHYALLRRFWRAIAPWRHPACRSCRASATIGKPGQTYEGAPATAQAVGRRSAICHPAARSPASELDARSRPMVDALKQFQATP